MRYLRRARKKNISEAGNGVWHASSEAFECLGEEIGLSIYDDAAVDIESFHQHQWMRSFDQLAIFGLQASLLKELSLEVHYRVYRDTAARDPWWESHRECDCPDGLTRQELADGAEFLKPYIRRKSLPDGLPMSVEAQAQSFATPTSSEFDAIASPPTPPSPH